MTKPVRTLIVDDEPIARRGLRHVVAARGAIEVVGECANGVEAVAAIRREPIDLVFLDIRMPALDGFGVIRTIGAQDMPCVVFVTAFDEHAIDAFAAAATDYVVKPFSPERLLEATDRALVRIREHRVVLAHEQLLQVLGTPIDPVAVAVDEPYAKRLLVSVGARSIVVPLTDVSLIEADGYYVRVTAASTKYTLRESLRELECRLNPQQFVRVHRSAIVRISAVVGVERIESDRVALVLANGTRIPVSRTRKDAVVRSLGSIRG
ncbi:MAG: LytTR family DNA-binding domain-containing protein [Gemmatimonadaceae bacterium]